MGRPKTIKEILSIQDIPVVSINDHGVLTFVNKAFTETYGWEQADLLDKPVTTIMPPQFRDAHVVGFSRFLATEEAKITGMPLPLSILFKDGHVEEAEHYILGEKIKGKWLFAATIILR
jgi:PAS domain S-box-containing protein